MAEQIKVRKLLFSEILNKVHKAKGRADKIKILKEEDCLALRQVLIWGFDGNLGSAVPSGTPPFIENEAPEGTEHMMLRTEAGKLWHFVKTGDKFANPALQSTVRERMFIRLLEGLHKDEAKILCWAKDGILGHSPTKNKDGIKGLSGDVVREAFGLNEDFKESK